MKKYLLILYLAIVCFSCSESNEPAPEYYIYATIDGQPFKYEGNDYNASNMPNSGYPSFYLGEILKHPLFPISFNFSFP